VLLALKKAFLLVADVLEKYIWHMISHLPATKRLNYKYVIVFFLVLQPPYA